MTAAPPPLHHLVYQSLATAPFSELELEALLVQSRAWNKDHDLTGVLLYSDCDIIQVLEGPQAEVDFIFARIQRDVRHYEVTKLADGPIQQRNFSQWSMGFKAVDSLNELPHLQGYLPPTRTAHLLATAAPTDASLHELLATFVREDGIRL